MEKSFLPQSWAGKQTLHFLSVIRILYGINGSKRLLHLYVSLIIVEFQLRWLELYPAKIMEVNSPFWRFCPWIFIIFHTNIGWFSIISKVEDIFQFFLVKIREILQKWLKWKTFHTVYPQIYLKFRLATSQSSKKKALV